VHPISHEARINHRNRGHPAAPRPSCRADCSKPCTEPKGHVPQVSAGSAAPAHQKIMEDPRSVEDLGDYSPPDLPRSAKLPRKSGLQPDRCLDGQPAGVFILGIWLWDAPDPPGDPDPPAAFRDWRTTARTGLIPRSRPIRREPEAALKPDLPAASTKRSLKTAATGVSGCLWWSRTGSAGRGGARRRGPRRPGSRLRRG
jgi:hypothetical protein